MRSVVMYKPGDLRLEETPDPKAGPGQVLVRVAACGVCGSDIPRMLTKGAHRMPIGDEIAKQCFKSVLVGNAEDLGKGIGESRVILGRGRRQQRAAGFGKNRMGGTVVEHGEMARDIGL